MLHNSPTNSFDLSNMGKLEFAFPGTLRDQLVAAVLSGVKTTTTTLMADYEHTGETLPQAGIRLQMMDSNEVPCAIVEIIEIRLMPLAQVDLEHVIAEGEGNTCIAGWRANHEQFWHSEEMRNFLGDAAFTVNDATVVVLEKFRLITDLRHNSM